MAKEVEKKDDLFGMNLGDGLIEIEESPAAKKEVETEEDKVDKKPEDILPAVDDDGSFEIDEFVQKTVETSATAEDESKEKSIEEQGKAPSDSNETSDSSPSSPFLAFAKDRASEGVFLEFDDEDWKALVEKNEGNESEALRELSDVSMTHKIQQGVDSYKESLTPDERILYEAKDKGLPMDEYAIAKRNAVKYSNIKKEDLSEDVKLQEELVSKALELRGFDADEIKEEIEGYKALENLEAKAEKALAALPQVYNKKVTDIETNAATDEESRKNNIRQRVAKIKQTIDTIPEIVPGIKLTKPTREKVLRSMTTPVARDAAGNPLNPVMATRAKNPDAFEMMVHYYHELGLFNIGDDGTVKPDFSKISKLEKVKAVDSMKTIFESPEKQATGKTKAIIPKDVNDDFAEAFGRIKTR